MASQDWVMPLSFEWDVGKAKSNAAKHGVSFSLAKLVFGDPYLFTYVDDTITHEEEREIAVGMAQDRTLGHRSAPSVKTADRSHRKTIDVV